MFFYDQDTFPDQQGGLKTRAQKGFYSLNKQFFSSCRINIYRNLFQMFLAQRSQMKTQNNFIFLWKSKETQKRLLSSNRIHEQRSENLLEAVHENVQTAPQSHRNAVSAADVSPEGL